MPNVSASDYAADAARLDTRVIELKDQGGSFQDIADTLGLSKSYVHRCFWRGIERVPVQAVEQYRAGQLARIALEREVALEVLTGTHPVVSNGRIMYPIVATGDDGRPVFGDVPLLDDGPKLAAIDRLVKLDDQEARLTGAYPAQKFQHEAQVSYTVGGGVDPASLT